MPAQVGKAVDTLIALPLSYSFFNEAGRI